MRESLCMALRWRGIKTQKLTHSRLMEFLPLFLHLLGKGNTCILFNFSLSYLYLMSVSISPLKFGRVICFLSFCVHIWRTILSQNGSYPESNPYLAHIIKLSFFFFFQLMVFA